MYSELSQMERSVGQQHPQFRRFVEKPRISESYPTKSSVIYKLLGVSAAGDSNLRILDEVEEDNLILVHYLEPTLETRHIRGVVIDVEKEQIVAESFPYTEELLPSEEKIKTVPLGTDCKVTKAFEGTILRVFRGRVSKNWYLSTHRKINGRRSRWAGPPFGKLFDSLWGDSGSDPESETPMETYLTPGNCYVFLLSHPDNRLVCRISEPCIHHVQTFGPGKEGQMAVTFTKLLKPHPNVKSQVVLNIQTTEDLIKKTEELDWQECSGLLVTQYATLSAEEKIVSCWKVIPESYQQRRCIRGNEPNFRFRYLQLNDLKWSSKGLGTQAQFRELFPEKKELFDMVDTHLENLPKFLMDFYNDRYKEGNFIYLPREIHFVLELTRSAYSPAMSLEENLKDNMESSDARQLNAMIRFMIEEQKEKDQ